MERLILNSIITTVSPYYCILIFLLCGVATDGKGCLLMSIIGSIEVLRTKRLGVSFKFGAEDLQRGMGTGKFIPPLSENHHIFG